MGDRRVRVMCVDDNRLVCDALRARLERDDRFEWVGGCSSAEGVVEEVARLKPDILLLDLDMPGPDPFEAVQALASDEFGGKGLGSGAGHTAVKVVIFTGHVRQALIDRAFEAGAWGYLAKNDSIELTLERLLRVAGGEVVLGDEVSGVLARE